MTLTATGIDIYQMSGTRTASRMPSVGWLAQITQKLNETRPRRGPGRRGRLLRQPGGGIEYFVWQSWAVDVSMRYHAVILHETTNHDVQFGIGLVFYASD
jgi:hypothetical protein